MKYTLPALFILLLLDSCKTELTQNEIEWIPYQKGEMLVFESSNFERDSFYISDITSSKLYKREIRTVECQYFQKAKDNSEKLDTIKTFLMALTANKESNTVMSLNVGRKFALFAPFMAKRLTQLDSMQRTSIEINNRTYSDIIILEPDNAHPEYLKYANDSLFVSKLYWSKSYGLMQFELSNTNTIWKLSKRYSR